jgi:aminoglycoside phosphotransferase (APT) family kinase protein
MRDTLRAWLSARIGVDVEIIELRRLSTGHSRAMWVCGLATGERFVVRIEQGGVFGTSSHDEFVFMQAAAERGIPVARVRWFEADPSVLGQPFFVMDFLDGAAGADERLVPADVAERFVSTLHALHASEWSGLIDAPSGPDGVVDAVDAQIDRWLTVAATSGRVVPPLLVDVARWLRRSLDRVAMPSLIHGDPGPGNFVHDGHDVVALTDWEFAHLGHPMEDWAFLISMRGARTMSADAWIDLIGRTTGVVVEADSLARWTVFNLFKGSCANLTCLGAFAGANPAPNMAIIGTTLHQFFLRRAVDLIDAA